MSNRPIPPPHKKTQTSKQTNKKHTHTNTSYIWYGAERAKVSRSCHGAPRHENGDIAGYILSRHKVVVTRELVEI